MCAVSNVGDNWGQKFNEIPWAVPGIPMPNPLTPSVPLFPPGTQPFNPPSREEFEELKRMVLEMKEELIAARAQDIANNEPDCEMEDKVAVLKKIAKMVGVSLEEVFPQSK
jgi:hypothetical protein